MISVECDSIQLAIFFTFLDQIFMYLGSELIHLLSEYLFIAALLLRKTVVAHQVMQALLLLSRGVLHAHASLKDRSDRIVILVLLRKCLLKGLLEVVIHE